MEKPEATKSSELTGRTRYVRPRVQTFTSEQLQTEFAEVFAQSASFSDTYSQLLSP
jgi:hypothetical protein